MRRAKKVALWSLAVLLSVTSAATLFLAVAGDDFYRWALARAIEGAMDREVRVDGSFSFDLGWEPTVVVTDVAIENAAWASRKDMARAKRIEMQLALRPLFSGILRVPRLVVEGLDLDLEKSADNQRNWQIGTPVKAAGEARGREKVAYPLTDFISLSDIAVTYRDAGSGEVMELRVDSLRKMGSGSGQPFQIHGRGSFNQHPFTLDGQLGTIEDAIAARAPYPVNIKLQSTALVVEASGTVANLPAGEGLDIALRAGTPSTHELLRALKIEGEVFGSARATARLKGDLAALAAEEIELVVLTSSGKELKADGRIADLTRGQGLDIRFAGNLDPKIFSLVGGLPSGVAGMLDGITEVEAQGRLAGRLERCALNDLTLRLQHADGAEIALEGGAEAEFSGADIVLTSFEATTRVALPDERLLARALGVRMPALGDLSATAELAWTGDWVTLRKATVEGKALEPVRITGEGKLGRFSGSEFTFDLDAELNLAGNAASSRPLFYLFAGFSPSQWRVPAPGADSAAGGEPGGAGNNLVLRVQQALTSGGTDPGAVDGVMGPRTRRSIEAYQARQGLPVDGRATQGLLAHLRATAGAVARDASAAEPIFRYNETVPELGPIDAAIKFHFKDQIFRFEDLNLAFGDDGAERISIAGMLGSLPAGPGGLLTGVDLAVNVTAPSSRRVVKFLPPEFPLLSDITGRLVAKGTENELAISDAEVSGKGPAGLTADITGKIGVVSFEKDFEVRALALMLDARWPDTHSAVDFFNQLDPSLELPEQDLPELGPVQARATLRDPDGTYAFDGIEVTAGSAERSLLRVTGAIGDVAAFRKIGLAGEFDIASALLAGRFFDIGDGALGSLRGRFELSDKDGRFGLENLTAAIADSDLLSLSVEGQLDDIAQGDGLRANVDLKVPDLAALGQELNFDAEKLGSLSFEGKLSGGVDRLTADGKARLGQTDMTGSLSGSLAGERPALTARVHSPQLRLADIGLVPRSDGEPEDPAGQPPFKGWLFDETPIPFEALRKFDLDLDVVLDAIEGVQLDIDKAAAKVDLVDGELKIAPLRFDFVGGRAEMTLLADSRGDRPKLRLEANADDVDLEALLSQAEVEVPLGGTMDVVADLAAQGNSLRELASSLNGNAQLAIADGQVNTGLLTLTTTNPMKWVFTESARKGYSKMNCLVMRFGIEDGLATSQALVLDTPSMLAQGEGQIDFRRETMDIQVNPQAKQKRLVEMTTPFSIKGPLSDPSLQVSTAKTALRAGGEMLLSPINLFGSLLPFVGKGGKDADNLCLSVKSVPDPE